MGPPVRGVGPLVLLDTVLNTSTTVARKSLVLKLQEILLHIFVDNLQGVVVYENYTAAFAEIAQF